LACIETGVAEAPMIVSGYIKEPVANALLSDQFMSAVRRIDELVVQVVRPRQV
jgi:hypothetical protein